MCFELGLHLALTVAIALGGWQDWQKREVSNGLTIPVYLLGIGMAVGRMIVAPSFVASIPLIMVVFLTTAGMLGWMGGADAKVQAGLWGAWPLAGMLALVATGVAGAVVMIRARSWKARLPAIAVSAISILVILVLECLVILLELN